jgi:hypothetical protein
MDNRFLALKQDVRKRMILSLKWAVGLGYIAIGSPGYRSKLITVVFHEVSDQPSTHAKLTNTYSTTQTYLKQISLLKSVFNFIDLQTQLDPIRTKKCLITFDDGYKGSLEAARILELSGIPSIHFVNLQTIYGDPNSSALLHFNSINSSLSTAWSNSKPNKISKILDEISNIEKEEFVKFAGPYLSPLELKELKTFKNVTFGDHFLNHWFANSLSENEVITNLARNAPQFLESEWIKNFFAAPHGEISKENIELVSSEGYKTIFSGQSWMTVGDAQVLPRIDMNESIKSRVTLFGSIAIMIFRSSRNNRSKEHLRESGSPAT